MKRGLPLLPRNGGKNRRPEMRGVSRRSYERARVRKGGHRISRSKLQGKIAPGRMGVTRMSARIKRKARIFAAGKDASDHRCLRSAEDLALRKEGKEEKQVLRGNTSAE